MKKKLVRLTESDLHRIVENSVKRILREDRNNLKLNYEEAKHKLENINTFGLNIDLNIERNEDGYPCVIARLTDESSSKLQNSDIFHGRMKNIIDKLISSMKNAGFELTGDMLFNGNLEWTYTTDMEDMWQKHNDRRDNLDYEDNVFSNKKVESYYDDEGNIHMNRI